MEVSLAASQDVWSWPKLDSWCGPTVSIPSCQADGWRDRLQFVQATKRSTRYWVDQLPYWQTFTGLHIWGHLLLSWSWLERALKAPSRTWDSCGRQSNQKILSRPFNERTGSCLHKWKRPSVQPSGCDHERTECSKETTSNGHREQPCLQFLDSGW